MTNGGPAHLYLNQGGSNQSLRIKLVGTKSNRDGIGAIVRVTAGNDKQWLTMKTGSSYLSQGELVLTFGMDRKRSRCGRNRLAQWPSGQARKHCGWTDCHRTGSKGPDRRAAVRKEVALCVLSTLSKSVILSGAGHSRSE